MKVGGDLGCVLAASGMGEGAFVGTSEWLEISGLDEATELVLFRLLLP